MKRISILAYFFYSFVFTPLHLHCIEKESVAVLLCGGIGNTFSQFAAAYTHARYNNIPLYLVPMQHNTICTLLKDKFEVARIEDLCFHLPIPIQKPNSYTQNFSEDLLHEKSICYRGNPLGEKWFARYKDEVIELLSCPTFLKNRIQEKYRHLLEKQITVGIHIRTWSPDEVISKQPKGTKSPWRHLFPTTKYLRNAMNHFPDNTTFIVCSDNIKKARALLKDIDKDIHFINDDEGIALKKFSFENQLVALEDLYLLSFCDHNIMTAGTFGWWGSYLNKNPNKIVICPRWYVVNKRRRKKDQYPKGWITMDMNYYN